jgi:hypothetical protein
MADGYDRLADHMEDQAGKRAKVTVIRDIH